MESFLQGSFAIAVAAFLLIRLEKRIDDLTKAINMLRHCTNCKLSPWQIVPNDEDYDSFFNLPGIERKGKQ